MDRKTGEQYVQRYYRALHEARDLRYFHIQVKETDLAVAIDQVHDTEHLIALCVKEVKRLRAELEGYLSRQPAFRTSFVPLALLPDAPEIARRMAEAAVQAGVGPMAAVAGAFAQAVGERLMREVKETIVENGGDIYLNSQRDRIVAVFAGPSRFSQRIGLKIKADSTPLGICTSSGTVGPSVSLGKADAVVILAPDTALADAVATGAANLVQDEEDLLKAIKYAQNIKGVQGILAIKGEKMAAWGELEIVRL
ncbi:MAG TPA: UPF0280 family protein [Syntrophomonas sp.]|nr:UPF0280 family protein [Syntrophomonas sp.]